MSTEKKRITTSPLPPEIYDKLKKGAQEKGFSSQGDYLKYIILAYLNNEFYLDHYDNLFSAQVDQSFNQIFEQLKLLNKETSRLADNADWLDQKFLNI